jgi:Rhs element Vgr protein
MLSNNTAPQPKSVVFHRIKINGREIDTSIGVLSLSIIRSFNKIAMAHVVIKDGEVGAKEFKESNKDLFIPGKELEILLGYANSNTLTSVFKGIITRHAISAPEKGQSRLTVEAKDKAVLLSLMRKTAFFTEMSDKEILQQLLQDTARMELEMDELGYKHSEMILFDSTIWDYMLLRGEANGLLVATEDGKIQLKKPKINPKADFKAIFGTNLLDVEAELDARRQLKKVVSASWDFTKQEIAEKEGTTQYQEAGNLSVETLANSFGNEERVTYNGHLKDKELSQLADAYSMRSALSKICGRARLKGEPSLKLGQTIELQGVSNRFNGLAYITGVVHNFSKGWETEVQFGWGEEWFYQQLYHENDKLALAPRITGTHLATVLEEGDNNDPDFKVKIKLPLVDPQGKGIWARLSSPQAGKNHGAHFRPQKGDEVLVIFINEDPRYPVVTGSLYSRDCLSGIASKSTDKKYGYRTEKDQQLIFNDENKSILLKTGDCSIKMDGQSNKIEIKMGQNNITLDASGIKINSNTIVEVKGSVIKLN